MTEDRMGREEPLAPAGADGKAAVPRWVLFRFLRRSEIHMGLLLSVTASGVEFFSPVEAGIGSEIDVDINRAFDAEAPADVTGRARVVSCSWVAAQEIYRVRTSFLNRRVEPDERREVPRRPVSASALCQRTASKAVFSCRVKNLSTRGIGLLVDGAERLHVDEELQVFLSNGNGEMRLTTEVCSVQDADDGNWFVGARFLGLEPADETEAGAL